MGRISFLSHPGEVLLHFWRIPKCMYLLDINSKTCKRCTCASLCFLFTDLIVDEKKRSRSARRSIRTPLSSSSPQPWSTIPTHLLSPLRNSTRARLYSTKNSPTPPITSTTQNNIAETPNPTLTHLNPQGNVHMVSISSKIPTVRTAIARCTIHFSNPTAIKLIRSNGVKKGDVLAVARIAGIMAAKRTGELIPLCHPVGITGVDIGLEVCGGEEVEEVKEEVTARWQGAGQGDAYPWHYQNSKSKLKPESASENENELARSKNEDFGCVEITTTVTCEGKTGVEMEALTAASVAALTVYDMCKSVDKGMRIGGLRVVRKEGGKSGLWVEGRKEERTEEEQR